jgi:hypothetical protein
MEHCIRIEIPQWRFLDANGGFASLETPLVTGLLRKANARTIEAVTEAIGKLLDEYTVEECATHRGATNATKMPSRDTATRPSLRILHSLSENRPIRRVRNVSEDQLRSPEPHCPDHAWADRFPPSERRRANHSDTFPFDEVRRKLWEGSHAANVDPLWN